MTPNGFEKIDTAYVNACNAVLRAFASTYEVSVDESDWVAGDVGGMVCVNEEYYIDLQDMRRMLANGISWNEFLRYWDYNLACAHASLDGMNFHSWLRGAPRYSKESIDRITKMKEELETLIKETKSNHKEGTF